MERGSSLQGNQNWGTCFLSDSYLGLGRDIVGGGRGQKLFPSWGSLTYLGSKNGLVGGVGSSSPPVSTQA